MSGLQSGWELTKENIQPLVSGRKMAHLAESLPNSSATGLNDQLQYEAQHMTEITKLEAKANQNLGEDPLQAWVDLVNYMEQHFPNMNKSIRAKHSQAVKHIIQLFYKDERYFRNDKRYANLLLKSVLDNSIPPLAQIRMLNTFIDTQRCHLVAEMYIRLSELYNREGDVKKASEVLRRGIEANAEPKCSLEEMLAHIQLSWAKEQALKLQGNMESLNQNSRKFASSVPTTGENNEAVSIRQNLQPAAPTNMLSQSTRTKNFNQPSQKLPLFNEENSVFKENQELETLQKAGSSNCNSQPILNNTENDIENNRDPTKWNEGNAQLNNHTIPGPPSKLKLYIESEERQTSRTSTQSFNANADGRVLKERKLTEIETCDFLLPQEKQINAKNEPEATKPNNSTSECPVPPKIPRKNYIPDLFENIKYTPLPPNKQVNRVMLTADKWWSERERQQKEIENENREVVQLRKEVEKLTTAIRSLEGKISEQQKHAELRLQEKDEKYDDLNHELTRLTTEFNKTTNTNNAQAAKIHHLEQKLFEEEKQRNALEEEVRRLKEENGMLMQEKHSRELESQRKANESSEYSVNEQKQEPFVNVMVRSRNGTRISESFSSPSTTEVVPATETSIMVEPVERTVAGTSFMPDLDNDRSMSMNVEMPRKIFGLVERPLDNDMNLTPAAAPPLDFEMPPPTFGLTLKKPPNKFSLYESISDSFAQPPPRVNPPNKRDIFKSLQMCSTEAENVLPIGISTSSDLQSNVATSAPESTIASDHQPKSSNIRDQFQRSKVPSRTSQGRKSLVGWSDYQSDEDEDEVILRRQQQTGMDLNISNLTTVLSLGPKPLVNSTPGRERTLRSLREEDALCANKAHPDTQEVPTSNNMTVAGSRTSRYNSILNDPALNLSTIQETSHENRSKSTTGSSSGNTTTRSAIGTTQVFGNITRSNPRSTGHISQNLNNNGYYSDTNAK